MRPVPGQATGVPGWERAQREAICLGCPDHRPGRCKAIAQGCKPAYVLALRAMKSKCPRDAWPAPKVPWIASSDLAARAVDLASLLPPDIQRVVGVPRSGMPAAAIVASMLHVPLFTVRGGDLIDVGHGQRLAGHLAARGRTVLIDDTIHHGGTLRRVRETCVDLAGCLVAVCYARRAVREVADYVAAELETPHLLEWNFGNHSYVRHLAFDLDGIICRNPPEAARPYLFGRQTKLGAIITARPENERADTVAWLEAWGVQTDNLVMWRGSERNRWRVREVGKWKARQTIRLGCEFYVESEPPIADEMRRHGVRVLCPVQGYLA